jgi:hypothetical protein
MSFLCDFCETKFQDATEVKIHIEACKKKNTKLHQKFANGLEKIGLTWDEVRTYICVGSVRLEERGRT